jgi:hypothetical protein
MRVCKNAVNFSAGTIFWLIFLILWWNKWRGSRDFNFLLGFKVDTMYSGPNSYWQLNTRFSIVLSRVRILSINTKNRTYWQKTYCSTFCVDRQYSYTALLSKWIRTGLYCISGFRVFPCFWILGYGF